MSSHSPNGFRLRRLFAAAPALILSLALNAVSAQEQPQTGRRGGGGAQQGAQQQGARPDAQAQGGAQQQQGGAQGGNQGGAPRPAPTPSDPAMTDSPPVVTHHSITVGGRALNYSVTTGVMPLRSAAGETDARIFYMAYTLDGVDDHAHRPLMFSFNGGPGSASVWLHMGALGPRRVEMMPDGQMPAPPFRLVDNEQTWLDFTDIVFIDPVGTGYSRAARLEVAQRYFGLQGDIQSVGEFIRLYLTKNERWTSPLFLVGESYGTTRASGLSGYLVDHGIAFNGIVLLSTVMNFETLTFRRGNDLPYALFLPTYTAIAWYHHKLAPDLQKDLRRAVEESERYAAGEYTTALAKGDKLSDAERHELVEKVARFTGLSREYVEQSDARIEIQHFDKELLRSERRTVGRLDGRFKGMDESAGSETPDFDPSMAAIRPPYTATFNNYVRGELNFKSDLEYYILGGGVGRWDYGSDNAFADTSTALRSAFAKNPYMKLFVGCGYYDLATPQFAARYTLDHMGLDPALRGNVSLHYYEAGHMMYIEQRSLAQLKRDVAGFVQSATAAR
ncbi:MAG: S10 family peptidase [Pyrinomonadaceae bacterium]